MRRFIQKKENTAQQRLTQILQEGLLNMKLDLVTTKKDLSISNLECLYNSYLTVFQVCLQHSRGREGGL